MRESPRFSPGAPSSKIGRMFSNVSLPPLAECLRIAVRGLRVLAGIAAINTGIAAVLAFGIKPDDTFWHDFVYSQAIGLSMWLLIDIPRHLLWGRGVPSRKVFPWIVVAAVLIGVPFGQWVARLILCTGDQPWRADSLRMSFIIAMLAALGATYFYWSRGKLAALQRQAALDALEREEAEKQVVRAQLMALQAQVEPHFIFNVLAHVDVLIARDPAGARRLLQHLIGFLRTSLAHARAEQCTLAQEFALLRAYLDIQALRFGTRLRFSLALDEAIADLVIPPMLIQPLVENAVVHGIEPSREGGTIALSARRDGDRLLLEVRDTGVGFGRDARPGTGSGLGLTHVRERLSRLFDAEARLTLAETVPHGVTVTVELPLAHDPAGTEVSGASASQWRCRFSRPAVAPALAPRAPAGT
ncbi:sensor histidine kinase [Ralstonia solanacearum]|uniref:sensor histidine kinase n=1 Tax=Ralstonia solanacearum TaxID=305 RepID=UPI000503864B|nr:sensor histidine kinase [Ralstonia solanacearum]KFX30226.1 histidine kinase [Ralstonia solanacearum]